MDRKEEEKSLLLLFFSLFLSKSSSPDTDDLRRSSKHSGPGRPQLINREEWKKRSSPAASTTYLRAQSDRVRNWQRENNRTLKPL